MNGIENGKDDLDIKNEDDDDDSDLDSDDEYDEYDKTMLENYATCIDANDEVDEFVIFKDTLQCNLLTIFSSHYTKKIIFQKFTSLLEPMI